MFHAHSFLPKFSFFVFKKFFPHLLNNKKKPNFLKLGDENKMDMILCDIHKF